MQQCSGPSRRSPLAEPPAELLRAHDSVRRADELGPALVRPGATGTEIDAAVCELFHEDGYSALLDDAVAGENTAISPPPFLGHGLGLDVHEDWYGLGPEYDGPLCEGDAITVEPELHREGWGCVSIEDVVLVTGDGCPDALAVRLRPAVVAAQNRCKAPQRSAVCRARAVL